MLGKTIFVGDTLMCVHDEEGGDSDSGWDLKKDQVYTVHTLHDEDGLLAPMVVLDNSESGQVMPERFVKLA